MDMSQYLGIFVEESRQHLQDLNNSLLELEKDPGNISILNEIFRVAHTLKGMAGTMGFTNMANLTHKMEDVLDGLRNERIQATGEVVDVLFKCLDALENYVDTVSSTSSEGDEEYSELVEFLSEFSTGGKAEKKPEKDTGQHESKSGQAEKSEGLRVDLSIYDKDVIEKAFQQSLKVYEIYVELDQKCLLKAARAFIVFQILEKNSDIIKSVPPVNDIEDEKFDYYFTVVVITQKDKDFFVREINSVSEVRKVEVTEITAKHLENINSAQEKDTAKQQTVKESKPEKKDAAVHKANDKKVTSKTVRVDIERLDMLMNLVSELIILKTRLDGIISAGERDRDIAQTLENLERVTTNLHDAVMKARMVPVETVFSRFPRMVRDIAKELDKDIVLHMSGEDTELDRTVIDEIGEPLVHIIRNSADHGIEKPDERIAKGKSKEGNIWLRAYQDGNNVVIEVEDDGAGINVDKVRKKVLEKGLESEEILNGMTDEEIIQFLFMPNFSTADKITDLSGRGVGLDVVKTKIEALGGNVELISRRGQGSKTIIRLPLTLAIIQALLVMVGNEKYAIPLNSIREIYNLNPQDIKYVRNQEVTVLRDTVIPIIRLHKVLDIEVPEDDANKKYLTCVVVKKGEKLTGLIVDSLINQQEIVIKSLGKLLSGIRFLGGATILGDGNVALILDVNAIV
ncbi:chemotaxis protein CheA [Thermoclostridium stercorarium subsp. leptospartum DSM 9219]|uniref:Chemotaxis protein CheA n=1 Tax=Thermoclostridium stercorarium subsp. leptospartum DSM 9219 TaxID=1346611 RepID=A0A1B1YIT9_THEST|nr:chemotaxis protein CheA [Thermoclostridium stercorarium]ANX00678.1 chemotaxis protein CheA [Thermoclostridium stercorarium subsp. leptospartum DSM 9219]